MLWVYEKPEINLLLSRNLAENMYPVLPTKGLENLKNLKTFNNKELKDFPPADTFPRIQLLTLSYAYHCCEFIHQDEEVRTPLCSRPKSSTYWSIHWLGEMFGIDKTRILMLCGEPIEISGYLCWLAI